jgi:hypothetical protein
LGGTPRRKRFCGSPGLQQSKRSQSGQDNVRYRNDVKRHAVARLTELVERHAPWLRIRYAF